MFGYAKAADYPPEICVNNCPRIWPQLTGDEETEVEVETGEVIPAEFTTEIGRILFKDRSEPCFLYFRIMRTQCRALRNFFIANASILEVIGAYYVGISTKIFNVNLNSVDGGDSVGLLRFKSTTDAYRFVNQEAKMNRAEFLGGKFDIWNITLCAEDKSLIPNINNPEKMVNGMNVFHMVHIKKISLQTGMELATPKEIAAIEKQVEKQQEAILDSLKDLEKHDGHLVSTTTRIARIRGIPIQNEAGIPRKQIFLTQWKGIHQFWKWYESPEGKKFAEALSEYAASDNHSILFTACLDFYDLL